MKINMPTKHAKKVESIGIISKKGDFKTSTVLWESTKSNQLRR